MNLPIQWANSHVSRILLKMPQILICTAYYTPTFSKKMKMKVNQNDRIKSWKNIHVGEIANAKSKMI